jgi:hypothetical protein
VETRGETRTGSQQWAPSGMEPRLCFPYARLQILHIGHIRAVNSCDRLIITARDAEP